MFNILLQVLDDGRLTDNHGHTVDFTNTIIVMTSNIGSQLIQEIAQEGGSEEEMREAVKEALHGPVPAGVPQPDRRDDHLPSARRSSRSARSSSSRSSGWSARRPRRGSTLECTRGGARRDRPARLRPHLRRPAAEAGDPAAAPKRAGPRTARRAVPGGEQCRRSTSCRTASCSRKRPERSVRRDRAVGRTEPSPQQRMLPQPLSAVFEAHADDQVIAAGGHLAELVGYRLLFADGGLLELRLNLASFCRRCRRRLISFIRLLMPPMRCCFLRGVQKPEA